MKVTGVSIHHVPDRVPGEDGDRGAPLMFCSIVLDESLVIHEVRLIGPHVDRSHLAMPSRRLTYRCGGCGHKVFYRSKYCSECGEKQGDHHLPAPNAVGRVVTHADVAHPLVQGLREEMLEHARHVFRTKV